MSARGKGCSECPHCQAPAVEVDDRVTVASIRSQLRPWEYAGYGQKITAIVDWYDGWWVGTVAETEDVEVPPQIIDKRQWVSGFVEGWKDAAGAREWRRERAEVHDEPNCDPAVDCKFVGPRDCPCRCHATDDAAAGYESWMGVIGRTLEKTL